MGHYDLLYPPKSSFTLTTKNMGKKMIFGFTVGKGGKGQGYSVACWDIIICSPSFETVIESCRDF